MSRLGSNGRSGMDSSNAFNFCSSISSANTLATMTMVREINFPKSQEERKVPYEHPDGFATYTDRATSAQHTICRTTRTPQRLACAPLCLQQHRRSTLKQDLLFPIAPYQHVTIPETRILYDRIGSKVLIPYQELLRHSQEDHPKTVISVQ